jgi:hypothetical protein
MVNYSAVARQQLVDWSLGVGYCERMVRLVEAAPRSDDGHPVAPGWRVCCQREVGEHFANSPTLAQGLNTPLVIAKLLERRE